MSLILNLNILFIFLYLSPSVFSDSTSGCRGYVDYCLVIDGSDSIGDDDFQTLRKSVEDLIDRLKIGEGTARLGMLVYSADIALEIPLTSDREYLKHYASVLPHPRDGTNTSLAINTMRMMFDQHGIRGRSQIGIVITDGLSKEPEETAYEAKLIKEKGVNMFAVGVTNYIDDIELNTIASSADKVYYADSFTFLADNIDSVVKMVCPTTPTTKPTTPVPTTTVIPLSTQKPPKGPCDDCKMVNGIGFNSHPDDCDKFVQCYFGKKGEIRGVYRQCPFGQYWDQSVLTCRLAEMVGCKNDKCQLPGLLSYPISDKGNCRAYWKCNFGKAIGMCCPIGYSYVPFQFCVENPKCKDKCPPQIYHEGACDTRLVFGKPEKYEQFVAGFGWIERPCAFGTRYDPNSCTCAYHDALNKPKDACRPELHLEFNNGFEDESGNGVYVENHNVTLTEYGAAYFDGENSKLTIPRFSNMQHYSDLYIKIRYLDIPSYDDQGLISNGDCCDNPATMMLIKGAENIHFVATCDKNQTTAFNLPYYPGNWNEVTYIHDTMKMEGISNDITKEDWAYGPIQTSHAGLQIGYVAGLKNFHGYIDCVSVYFCRPEY